MWLTRSRCLPLHLHFNYDFAPARAAEALASVVPHRARWEYLNLHHFPTSHLHILEGPMPLLRRLDRLSRDHTTTKFTCHRAPLLRAAFLNDTAAESVVLPWAQLTSLTLDWMFSQECVTILQQTPNLVHCELALLSDDDDEESIILSSLRSLTLDGGGLVSRFLKSLFVPSMISESRNRSSAAGPTPSIHWSHLYQNPAASHIEPEYPRSPTARRFH
ncbi:hypothetical protein B0H14DRAFT_547740 [Mycena olivaceomarginata]|nr:hypothetical protein B0H14DRAFT_547740 [Mycena olivaceomarginata]